MSAFGSAPRRRESSVEEGSTRIAVWLRSSSLPQDDWICSAAVPRGAEASAILYAAVLYSLARIGALLTELLIHCVKCDIELT